MFFLRTIGDGFAVRDHLAEQSPASAVVVGGGYVGLEMAGALNDVDLTYTPPLSTPCDAVQMAVQAWMKKAGEGRPKA